jgi:hypothetical protein
MTQGIKVFDSSLSTGFTTERTRMQIAIDRTPPHLQVFDSIAGSALVTNAGNGYYAEEIVFSLHHNLGFRPKVYVYYFYLNGPSISRGYALGTFFIAYGVYEDALKYRVTDTEFLIYHYVDDTFFNTGVTSLAPNFQMRIKYMLCSTPIDNYTDSIFRV